MISYLLGEVVAVKVLDSIHEKIEEIEEEYRILHDLGNHPNIPRFHGIYLKPPTTGIDAEVWIAMEVSYWDIWNWSSDGKNTMNMLFVLKIILIFECVS